MEFDDTNDFEETLDQEDCTDDDLELSDPDIELADEDLEPDFMDEDSELTEDEAPELTDPEPDFLDEDQDLTEADLDLTEADPDFLDDESELPDTEPELSEADQDPEAPELQRIENMDGHTFYYDSNGEIYRVDDTIMGNGQFDLDDFHFITDEEGRTHTVEGQLFNKDGERETIKDKMQNIGMGDELEDDDRGHIIADRFSGPNDIINLIPQNMSVNRGEYNTFEGKLSKLVDQGHDVRVNMEMNYPEGSFRPDSILTTYLVDDDIYQRTFSNYKE